MTNIQPGPELDRLIGEKVMGECRHDWETIGPNVWDYGCKKCTEKFHGFSRKPPLVGMGNQEYSTTWSGMQLVVEEMQRRGWNMALLMRGQTFGVGFSKDGMRYAEESDSSPHAVCMAALSALEGQRDE